MGYLVEQYNVTVGELMNILSAFRTDTQVDTFTIFDDVDGDPKAVGLRIDGQRILVWAREVFDVE